MLTPAKQLREKLSSNETVVGVMATDHVWPQLVEVCQRGGLDYLVVDREHGAHSDELVAQVCQVARLAEFPVLMRTVSCETSELRRAADLGPCGVVLPGVETVDQLDAAHVTPYGCRPVENGVPVAWAIIGCEISITRPGEMSLNCISS